MPGFPLKTLPKTLTMSSREIATLTGKEHFNVLRDIDSMLSDIQNANSDLSLRRPELEGTFQVPGPNGTTRSEREFNLDQELTFTLLTGYNAALRHKVVKRWLELEKAQSRPRFDERNVDGPMFEEMLVTARKVAQKQLMGVASKQFRRAMRRTGTLEEDLRLASWEFYFVNASKFLKMEEDEARLIGRIGAQRETIALEN